MARSPRTALVLIVGIAIGAWVASMSLHTSRTTMVDLQWRTLHKQNLSLVDITRGEVAINRSSEVASNMPLALQSMPNNVTGITAVSRGTKKISSVSSVIIAKEDYWVDTIFKVGRLEPAPSISAVRVTYYSECGEVYTVRMHA